jgi:hypothetical protein
MTYEGPVTTARGYGEVKMVDKGSALIKKIDEHGITMNIRGTEYHLRPYRGKRYLFEQIR